MKQSLSFVLLSGSFMVGSTTSVPAFVGVQESFNKKIQTHFLQDDQIKCLTKTVADKQALQIVHDYAIPVVFKALLHSCGLKCESFFFTALRGARSLPLVESLTQKILFKKDKSHLKTKQNSCHFKEE